MQTMLVSVRNVFSHVLTAHLQQFVSTVLLGISWILIVDVLQHVVIFHILELMDYASNALMAVRPVWVLFHTVHLVLMELYCSTILVLVHAQVVITIILILLARHVLLLAKLVAQDQYAKHVYLLTIYTMEQYALAHVLTDIYQWLQAASLVIRLAPLVP